MRKVLLFTAAAIATTFTIEPAELINMKTGYTIVAFENGQSQFYDRFLEVEMQEVGIFIPSSMAKDFGEKEVIYLQDPLFEKAFIEVYYPLCMTNTLYQWHNVR